MIGDGFQGVVPFLFAFRCGELLWLVATVLGLSALAWALGATFLLLRWLGVAYLLVLVWRMWHRPVSPRAEPPQAMSGRDVFLTGTALTLGNSKINQPVRGLGWLF